MLLAPLVFLTVALFAKEKSVMKKISIILAGITVFYIIFFRYGLGSDYFSYKSIYQSTQNSSLSLSLRKFDSIEYSYLLINQILNRLGVSYQSFVGFIGLVVVTCYIYWANAMTTGKEKILSLMIFYGMFFLVWVLSAFRQGLVISISLVTVFNPRLSMSLKKKVGIVLLLSLLHYSSLILLVYLILNKFINSKKDFRLFFGMSILLSVLVYFSTNYLVNVDLLNNIKIISKALSYLNQDGISVFAIIVRGILLTYLWLFYESFSKDPITFSIYKYFLIGIGLYIMMSPSALISSRMTIYSYIMVPVLLSKTIHYIKNIKLSHKFENQLPMIMTISMIVFSVFFYFKEINAFSNQSGYTGDLKFNFIPTVFNRRNFEFKSKFAAEDSINEMHKQLEKNHTNLGVDLNYKYNPDDYFTHVKQDDQGTFGIINQDGIIVTNSNMKHVPEVYGPLYSRYIQKGSYDSYVFASIDPNPELDKIALANEVREEQLNILIQPVYMMTKYKQENVSEIDNYMTEIGVQEYMILKEKRFTRPFKYSIFEVEIYGAKYSLLFLNEGIVNTVPYKEYEVYDVNGFMRFKTDESVHIYNKEGELVWIER